jgi:hypothetical protein
MECPTSPPGIDSHELVLGSKPIQNQALKSSYLYRHIYDCTLLAALFNFEISGLADRFLMEIEQNVNSGWEKGSFQRYLFRTEKICNLK